MSDEKEMLFMHCQRDGAYLRYLIDDYVRIREELGQFQDMGALIKKLDKYLWNLLIKQAGEARKRDAE